MLAILAMLLATLTLPTLVFITAMLATLTLDTTERGPLMPSQRPMLTMDMVVTDMVVMPAPTLVDTEATTTDKSQRLS